MSCLNKDQTILIFASQVLDSLTLVYNLADLASDYMTCPEIPWPTSKQHENNKTVASRLKFKQKQI